MDVDPNNIATNVATGNTAGASAPSASSIQPQALWLPRGGQRRNPQTLTFKKSRTFYSYGCAFNHIKIGGDNNFPNMEVTTPLASLWVDYLPSYLNPAEWRALPLGAIAKTARVNVSFLGSRTSFETGATLSGLRILNMFRLAW